MLEWIVCKSLILGPQYVRIQLLLTITKVDQTIIDGLKKPIPVILYAKGMNHCLNQQLKTGAKILSLDWTISLKDAARETNNQCALQGNLDPQFLTTDPSTVKKETESY